MELFWIPYFIVLTVQTMVRFGIDNIIYSFKMHDTRCGMRLRTFADLFNLAIVISHFLSVHKFLIQNATF